MDNIEENSYSIGCKALFGAFNLGINGASITVLHVSGLIPCRAKFHTQLQWFINRKFKIFCTAAMLFTEIDFNILHDIKIHNFMK